MTKIRSTITVGGSICFKAKTNGIEYVKLVPYYDIEYGVILKMVYPTDLTITLDKSWMWLRYSNSDDAFRVVCPKFLKKYKGATIEFYEDEYAEPNELCRARCVTRSLALIGHLIEIPKGMKYNPGFSLDGRMHISLAYVRNNFPNNARRDPCMQALVINQAIIVLIVSERLLDKDDIFLKLTKGEHEFVSPPVKEISELLKESIIKFKYFKHKRTENSIVIHIKGEVLCERRDRRVERRVLSLRERARRVRRQRTADS